MTQMDSLYSVVIPVYNSEAIVEKTVTAVVDFFKANNLRFEIILINDGSPDNSWEVIKNLPDQFQEVVSINLLKNYGQHSAVYCGIREAKGDFIITMDDDMQNPPSEIIHLITKINEGYDAVFGEFKRKQHAGYRKLGTKVIDYLNTKIFNKPKDLKLTNFRIFTAEVANRMGQYRTFFPYIPGLVLLSSSKMANVLCEHRAREIGSSNYNLWRIAKLTSRILFNYSSFPLKFLSTIGVGVSIISAIGGIFYLVRGLMFGSKVAGWTSLIVIVSFLCGFIILMLGIIGEYLSRILNQMSTMESYQVKQIVRS
ncbi:MAG: glycosyltransferase [Chitinophagales bacterium]|nr:glycosyltransferase [Chitinophagales bacterium]